MFTHQFNYQDLLHLRATRTAIAVATFSGVVAGITWYIDKHVNPGILNRNMPDEIVFNVFVMFTSFTMAFRTSHALQRYTDAASYVHKLSGCWFDVASTLCCFCRVATADEEVTDRFQHILIRLSSLLSALCLDYLQGGDGTSIANQFEVFDLEDFDEMTLKGILECDHKVEFVFQQLQQCIVDNMNNGVLCIAPPILTRAFHELGSGLLTFHEAKKLACIPVPASYTGLAGLILGCQLLFVPLMVAAFTKGVYSAVLFTFMGTFLVWALEGIACSLSNPFSPEACTLHLQEVQLEFNEHLVQLLLQKNLEPSMRKSVDDLREGIVSLGSHRLLGQIAKAMPSTASNTSVTPKAPLKGQKPKRSLSGRRRSRATHLNRPTMLATTPQAIESANSMLRFLAHKDLSAHPRTRGFVSESSCFSRAEVIDLDSPTRPNGNNNLCGNSGGGNNNNNNSNSYNSSGNTNSNNSSSNSVAGNGLLQQRPLSSTSLSTPKACHQKSTGAESQETNCSVRSYVLAVDVDEVGQTVALEEGQLQQLPTRQVEAPQLPIPSVNSRSPARQSAEPAEGRILRTCSGKRFGQDEKASTVGASPTGSQSARGFPMAPPPPGGIARRALQQHLAFKQETTRSLQDAAHNQETLPGMANPQSEATLAGMLA